MTSQAVYWGSVVIAAVVIIAMLVIVFGCAGVVIAEPTPEDRCLQFGWTRVDTRIAGHDRKVLWRGPGSPQGPWTAGVILVAHGGGGKAADWCVTHTTAGGIPAQVDFVVAALDRGYGVVLLESTTTGVSDDNGLACGKRFDATVVRGRNNVDLPYYEWILTELVPAVRPSGSSTKIFLTGESTGGFMTVRAATTFDGLVTAFAPGAAMDPYAAFFNCHPDLSGREAEGVGYSLLTLREFGKRDACEVSVPYRRSEIPSTQYPTLKPPFKLVHHADDGIVDLSCHRQLETALKARGYSSDGPFVIPTAGGAHGLRQHLWQPEYAAPILDFFGRVQGR